MRLLAYVLTSDTGFAPNPFGGYCTLAACTPNHMGAKVTPGEWLIGHSSLSEGNKLIYAMKISEILSFDEYFLDPRFGIKKPRYDKTWREACGDNVYTRDTRGTWVQSPTPFHNTPYYFAKDTKYPRVFISEHFYYFGENAPDLPPDCADLIWRRRGFKYHDGAIVERFLEWLSTSFKPGVHGDPRDKETDIELLQNACGTC